MPRTPISPKTPKPAKASKPTAAAAPTRASARKYDAIVIGGGHNGLVNGAYLAKAGLKTCLLYTSPSPRD